MKLSKKQALAAIEQAVRTRYQSDHHLERQVEQVRRILADAGYGQEDDGHEEARGLADPLANSRPFELPPEFPLATPPTRLWTKGELAALPDWTVVAPRDDTLLGNGLWTPSMAYLRGGDFPGWVEVVPFDEQTHDFDRLQRLRDELDKAALKRWPDLPGLEGRRPDGDQLWHVVFDGDPTDANPSVFVDVNKVNPLSHEEYWTTLVGKRDDMPLLWAQALGTTLIKVPLDRRRRSVWLVLNRLRDEDGQLLPLPPFAGAEEGAVIER